MLRKNLMYRNKKKTKKEVMLWLLIPLIFFNQAFGMVQGASALVYGALQVAQALVYAYGNYGAAYKNAYDINHQIMNMPQLNAQIMSQMHNSPTHMPTPHAATQPSLLGTNQAYKAMFTQNSSRSFGAQIFSNKLFPQPASASVAIQSPVSCSIFKAHRATAGYNVYTNVVSQPSMWDNIVIQCDAGGQQFQRGPVDVRFETMKSLFSNANAFLAQAQHLDFLESKIAAVSQSPLINVSINIATDLFHNTIMHGVGVAQATDFIKNVTQLHDSLSIAISRVDNAQAAALCDIRQAVRSLIYETHTRNGDFIGVVTAEQKQAVTDVYARMLGNLAQGGFEQTLNARIEAGADYLIPSRDFYFPKGWSKVLYAPLNMLREGVSVRGINVASAWCHGEKITEKINNSRLNKTIHEVQSLVHHGFLDQASRLVENFNPAYNKDGRCDYTHCYAVLKEAFSSAKVATLNEFGIPKIYEMHPQWDAFKDALLADPSCQGKVLWQLEHEQAFALKLLHDIHIANPTESQLKTVYNLCSYSDLYCFERAVSGISSYSDVQKAIDKLTVYRIECDAVYSSFLGLGFTPSQFEAYMPNFMEFARDPQFLPLLNMLKEQSGSMRDFLGIMTEREKASVTLLKRSGIYRPSDLEKQMSYHLIDVMHDKFKVIELLGSLDPQHENSLVRQAYHNFFDKQGIQKVLPVNDQVRALLQDRLGQINLHQDSAMRLASNKLAIFDATVDEHLDIIGRGCNYIAQGASSASYADLVRNYAAQYVYALVQPHDATAHILSVSNLVDGFLQPMPDSIRQAYGDLLSQVLDASSQLPLHPDLAQQVVEHLGNVAKHVGASDFDLARRDLDVIAQLGLPVGTAEISIDSTPSMFLQPEPTCSSSVSETVRDVALTAAFSEFVRNGFPISSRSQSLQSQSQGQAEKDAMRKILRDRLIKFEEAKKKLNSFSTLARELLSEGEVVDATADGVVVELSPEVFVHVGRDGSVAMMHPQCEQAGNYADDIQDLAQRIGETRLARDAALSAARAAHADMQSHSSSSAAASSSDAGEPDSLGDLIAHLAKEHAKKAQQSSRAANSSAGGGAPPPNDPRNNRNKGRPNVPERVTEKVGNMKEFFETPFGQTLKGRVQKTNYTFQERAIYQVTEKTAYAELKKGYYFYLDAKHKDHVEVFSSPRVCSAVINIDGTFNIEKTLRAQQEGRRIKI